MVGDGASLLVDTLWDPRLTRRMLAAMAPLTADAPIETLVNTHSDGDHWWGNQEVAGAEIVATDAAAAVMREESPAEMKRFGGLARALRLAGSSPVPYPRRGDVAAIAAYVGEALAPFAFGDVRLVRPTRTFSGRARARRRRPRGAPDRGRPRAHTGRPDRLGAGRADRDRGRHPLHRRHADHVGGPARGTGSPPSSGCSSSAPSASSPVTARSAGPSEVERLIDYWRWLDRAASQRLDAGLSPADTARELVLGEEIAERGFAEWLAPERALVSVADDRRAPPRHRGPAGPARADRRVLPDGAARARPPERPTAARRRPSEQSR